MWGRGRICFSDVLLRMQRIQGGTEFMAEDSQREPYMENQQKRLSNIPNFCPTGPPYECAWEPSVCTFTHVLNLHVRGVTQERRSGVRQSTCLTSGSVSPGPRIRERLQCGEGQVGCGKKEGGSVCPPNEGNFFFFLEQQRYNKALRSVRVRTRSAANAATRVGQGQPRTVRIRYGNQR